MLTPDAKEMTSKWRAAFAECPPVTHNLRHWFPDRWVRFHGLPGSKRYAETASEYAEILRRHKHVIRGLLATDAEARSPANVLVVGASWSGSPEPTPRSTEEASALPARYWTSVRPDGSDPDNPIWTHLWFSRVLFDDPALDRVLRLVADDRARVIVLSDSFTWLFGPYDGGADIIASSRAEREALKSNHDDWLSTHPSGL